MRIVRSDVKPSDFCPKQIFRRTAESYNNIESTDGGYLSAEHIELLFAESELVKIDEYQDTETIKGGRLHHIALETAQGFGHDCLLGVPDNLRNPIPIVVTSAWFTSLDGHNERVLRSLVRNGNAVVMVGAEGSYTFASGKGPERPITLANSAATVLSASNTLTSAYEAGLKGIDAKRVIVLGESRGAMVGMGIVALADRFEKTVAMADLTAPCIPEKMKLSDVPRLIDQVRKEPLEMLKLAETLGLSRLINYRNTVDFNLDNLRHQLIVGGAIFSGEAGELAKRIPREALMHITIFDNDFASMPHVWEKIFQNHFNVRITKLQGGHMTLADNETHLFILRRNAAMIENESVGIEHSQSSVFDKAHSIEPEYQPQSSGRKELVTTLAQLAIGGWLLQPLRRATGKHHLPSKYAHRKTLEHVA